MSSKKDQEKKEVIPINPEPEKPKQETPVKDSNPVLMASRIFVKQLQKEDGNKNVSPSVFVAFISVAPKADTEENYRKLWKKTFKRD